MFLAVDDRGVRGRIAAIEDRLHNETHRERLGFFGFFEADDEQTASVLLAAVEAWARRRGCRAVRGPVNPSLNESAGLLVDAFDADPFMLMPYNPPEYADWIAGAGYVKVKDLLAWSIDLTAPLGERIVRIADRVRKRHDITVRPVNMRAFRQDLDILKTIYRAAWQANWGFVAPTDREIDALAHDLKPIIDPDLVLFAEAHGRPVACAVTVPDANQVLKRMRGDLLPVGIFHFLRRKRIITQARLLLLGVLPELRRIGLYPLLIAESHRRTVANGYVRGEMGWTLEDNAVINTGIEATGSHRSKTYRLYEKPIG